MTLARGDKVVKLDSATGQPLTTEKESYIEFEVHDLGNHLSLKRNDEDGYETFVVVLLRKLR